MSLEGDREEAIFERDRLANERDETRMSPLIKINTSLKTLTKWIH